MTAHDLPRVLSIAGSDSGGGAGIQADLKAIARCGAHGMTAITAVTAQNTRAVEAVFALPAGAVLAQVRAVVADIGVDAVKVGMLGSAKTIAEVDEALELVGDAPVVVDPVMVAESGATLLEEDAVDALVRRIVPRAAVITPNVPEARALAVAAGREADGLSAEELAVALLALGPRAVVVTGGHRDEPVDVYADMSGVSEIPGPLHPPGAAHGSGCTHSSALASFLAAGSDPLDAARRARVVAGDAVRDGLREIGGGAGPVDALDVRRRGGGAG